MNNDPILYWNEVALEANRVSHTTDADSPLIKGPTMSSRALAIVHLAMYDAFIGTSTSTLGAYLNEPQIVGASPSAAIASAAHATLSKLYPSQKDTFEAKQALAMALITGTIDEINLGHNYGQMIAEKMLKDRKDDINANDDGYATYPTHGKHRPDPWSLKSDHHGPFYGKNKLFSSSIRYGLNTPPKPSSIDPDYMRAFKQVRGYGITADLMGTLPTAITKRNEDQTVAGIFWGYDGAKELGTPPRLYNQIIREIAIATGNNIERNAHLFALINVSMGDAGILAWHEKYRYNYWRPVLGIREHDASMGPISTPAVSIGADCDTQWLPLGAPNTNNQNSNNQTPNFPAYPSGHATFGAATFNIAKLFYNKHGVNLTPILNNLGFVSDEFNGKSADNKGIIRPKHKRKFETLDQMIIENGFSRVYLGVHWSFDAFAVKATGAPDLSKNIGGVPLGVNISTNIFGTGNSIEKSTV
jgi:hypothetical protein